MKKKKIRDSPEIVIPKGYGIDLLDFYDEKYENGEYHFLSSLVEVEG